MDKSMRNFKKNILNKQKTPSNHLSVEIKSGNEYIYGDQGEFIKLTKN